MPVPVDCDCVVFSPSLLRAIEEHKYLRSCASCCEVDFMDAAREFRSRHEGQWRAAKARADNAQQAQEMHKHLWIESEKAGRDLGRNVAGTDWVVKYAAAWRRQRESLHTNGFLDLDATIPPGAEPGAARIEELAEVVSRFYADVFVSQDGIERPHFRMEVEPGSRPIPFLVFRATRRADLSQIRATAGRQLRFVAYGRESGQAIACLRAALS